MICDRQSLIALLNAMILTPDINTSDTEVTELGSGPIVVRSASNCVSSSAYENEREGRCLESNLSVQ